MDNVRVAIIGGGRIADMHYPAYVDFPDAELVTVCDVDERTARRRQAEWKTPKFATDYRTVLDDPEIDMVEILAPHHLHHRMVLDAAAAGKHVQLQKPMGINIAECDDMIRAAREAGIRFKVIENFVFYPPYRKAKELIDAGEIGEMQSIRFKLGSGATGGWYAPLTAWIWRLAETDKGGGPAVYDDGYHKFSMGLFFGGPVETVFAWIDRSMALIDMPAVISWRHTSGVLGCFDIAFSPNLNVPSKYYSADERVEITGTKGYLHVTRCTAKLLDEPALVLYRDGRRTGFEDLRTDWLDSFRDSTRHFIGCIKDGGEPMLTGEQAKAVQQFVFAAIRSGREGRTVRPEEITE